MSEISDRYRKVARTFTDRVESVPDGAWDNAAPCEGWVARDVVRHLVEWVPGFFGGADAVAFADGPSVDADPAAAWRVFNDSIQAALDDPSVAESEFDSQTGRSTVEAAVASFVLPDVLVHTWDLARATGLDETLDAAEVHGLLEGMEPMDQVLRDSGHFGPRVEVGPDADEQTRLIAFTGRTP